jgi:uncharacterized LabA/DUF88 family protein
MTQTTNENNYAFIDAQNLHLGVSKNVINKHGKMLFEGWELDMQRFFVFLTNKYKVKKAILFMGYIPAYKEMYEYFKKIGYDIIFKPTVLDNNGKAKGNCDAELVLHAAAIEYQNYDKAIIVTGDGDFTCLINYLHENQKLQRLLAPNVFTCSSLIKTNKKLARFLEYIHLKKNKLMRR